MPWHPRLNAFECLGCGQWMPVGRRIWTDAERLASMHELLILDHAECWRYPDAGKAAQARRWRKARLRRELIRARAARALDRGPGAR